MPLTWDLTKIENNEALWIGEGKDTTMDPITNIVILSTMVMGIGTITEKNAPEFYRRFNLYQRNVDPLLTKKAKPYYLTLEDVKRHIGLRTNVSEQSSKSWNTRFKQILYDRAMRAVETPKEHLAHFLPN